MAAAKRICAAAFLAVLIVFSAAVYGPGVRYVLSCLPALAAADLSAPEARAAALAPIKEEFDLRTTDLNPLYHRMINVNSLFEMLCGNCVFQDDAEYVVKLRNGYLAFMEPVSVTSLPYDVKSKAQDMIRLQKACAEQGTQLLYVMPPYKVSKYDPQLPHHLQDITNPLADAFLAELDGQVPYIDLRQVLHDAGIDQYDFFFRTDHHWTPEGAFWCCRYVTDVLRRDLGLQFDPGLFDDANFSQQVYPQYFLGSAGKKVGTVVTGVDDFTLITPRFDTSFTRVSNSSGAVVQGPFEQAVLNLENLRKDYYLSNAYGAYLSDTDCTIFNEMAPNDTHILLVGDSFQCAFDPFLALTCRELELCSFSAQDPIDEHIRRTKPDIVIVLYYARNMGNLVLFP